MGFTLMKRQAIEDFDTTQFTILLWVGFSVAMSVTLLRLGVRLRLHQRFYWDDGLCIVATAFLTTFCVLVEVEKDRIYMQQSLARGKTPPYPQWTPENIAWGITSQSKIQFAAIVVLFTCIWACKFSLLMFYREMYKKLIKVTEMKNFMRWWWIVIGCCIISYLIVELTNVLSCIPTSRRWQLENACNFDNAINGLYVYAVVDVLTDLMVMALPIRLLLGIEITMRQKFALASIFTVGFLIIAISITRTVKVVQSLKTYQVDVTIISLTLWSLIEGAVAVIVISLPPLKSLMNRSRHQRDDQVRSNDLDEHIGKLGECA